MSELPADRLGYMNWSPSKVKHLKVQTWYRVNGDLSSKHGKAPLICAHGGPGAAHNYLLAMTDLAKDRPVIFYDQLGCGLSTHLPGEMDNLKLWGTDLFVEELNLLVKHLKLASFHLLGQSWGGWLAQAYVLKYPHKVQGLILADTLNDYPSGIAGMKRWIAQLPKEMAEAIRNGEKDNKFDSPEYKAASEEFYRQHVCRLQPQPAEVAESFAQMERDPTVYYSLNGPSEFSIIGPLKDETLVPAVEKIRNPILVVHGQYDELLYNQDEMIATLKGAKSIDHQQFPNSSHMPHYEDRKAYMACVNKFLDKVDSEAVASWCTVA